mmetsp:Transcript_25279/g.60872  ORF Transcript_25279/g.60872 Transcript_25279/m.60872 type:complete len:225 (-) Transcript_25279:141-815(-)
MFWDLKGVSKAITILVVPDHLAPPVSLARQDVPFGEHSTVLGVLAVVAFHSRSSISKTQVVSSDVENGLQRGEANADQAFIHNRDLETIATFGYAGVCPDSEPVFSALSAALTAKAGRVHGYLGVPIVLVQLYTMSLCERLDLSLSSIATHFPLIHIPLLSILQSFVYQLKDRKAESPSLPAPCLCSDHNVATAKDQRNGLVLNRCLQKPPHFFQCVNDLVQDA